MKRMKWIRGETGIGVEDKSFGGVKGTVILAIHVAIDLVPVLNNTWAYSENLLSLVLT